MNTHSTLDLQCLQCRNWTPPLPACAHCGAPLNLAPEQRRLGLITTTRQTAIGLGVLGAFFAMGLAGGSWPELPGWVYPVVGSLAFALLAGLVFLFARRR